MIFHETLSPAYGRDYKSIEEVTNAFHSNKDFVMSSSGSMCNKQDIKQFSPNATEVKVRYAKLRKVTLIKL